MKIMYLLIGLMLVSASVFAYSACDEAGKNLNAGVQCLINTGLGGSMDLFAILVIAGVIVLAFAAKIPGPLALVIGISLTFGLDVMLGRSILLEGLIFLQLIGIVVIIFTSFFNLGKVME